MRRRDFVAAVGATGLGATGLGATGLGATGLGVALTLAPQARAQQAGRIYRIGVLTQSSRRMVHLVAFFDELRQLGLAEGQNLEVVPGSFDVRIEQLPERAAAIVKAAPDIIVTAGEVATRAAQAATRTIPIVGGAEDMVAAGLVDSLARPGGNITGTSMLSPGLDGKRQDILIEAVPGARRIAALADSSQVQTTTRQHLESLLAVARARGVELSSFPIASPEQIGPAIANVRASGAAALNVLASPMFSANRRTIFESVAAARLPAVYQWPDMADQGGFAAYGPSLAELYRQRARMTARLLRGARPSDIPVEQPTSFELVINLKTAKAIGHEVPASLVLRADRVIE